MDDAEESDMHHNMLQDISENVGMQIYLFLHPKDLLHFSLCSRHFWNDIARNKLAQICGYHLPLQLGVGTNYFAEFREEHSFSSKAELLEYVLDKAEAAGLLLVDAASIEESRSMAREMLLGDNDTKSTAKFYHNTILPPITVECHYDGRIGKDSATSWANYISDRDACRQNKKDRGTYKIIKAWLDFLFSQRNIDYGIWRWSCKHRTLNGHGIAGVGVMIMTTSSGGTNDTLEVRLTRKY